MPVQLVAPPFLVPWPISRNVTGDAIECHGQKMFVDVPLACLSQKSEPMANREDYGASLQPVANLNEWTAH